MSSRLVVPRRTVLKGLGAAGLAGVSACAPDPARKPTAAERGRIDTVVLCMMENRSFDHVFGSLSLLEGRADIDGLVDGMSNPDLDGNPVPIGPLVDPCTNPDPPHDWDGSRTQLDGGSCQGFVRAYLEDNGRGAPAGNVMAYQTREIAPISYALADRYALCQRWFSSVLTSTWPNRLYFHAAQSQGMATNDLPPGGTYTCRTLWDQLDDAGVEWAYYFTDLPTLALFGRSTWAPRLRLIEDFYADAAAGALPPVVCVDPGTTFNDDHPPHHPLLGQLFLGSIYGALAASPHWATSLFLATYDEAGGFFDHVAPGTMPDDYADQGFDQLGFRVPALAMGPYVRRVVTDTVFDHTAGIRFVQDHFGIDERLTARDAASNDLAEVLDADALAAGDPSDPIALPRIEKSEAEIEAECRALEGGRCGQPELRALVRERAPHLDRTAQAPDLARQAWRRAHDLGLWKPQ